MNIRIYSKDHLYQYMQMNKQCHSCVTQSTSKLCLIDVQVGGGCRYVRGQRCQVTARAVQPRPFAATLSRTKVGLVAATVIAGP